MESGNKWQVLGMGYREIGEGRSDMSDFKGNREKGGIVWWYDSSGERKIQVRYGMFWHQSQILKLQIQTLKRHFFTKG